MQATGEGGVRVVEECGIGGERVGRGVGGMGGDEKGRGQKAGVGRGKMEGKEGIGEGWREVGERG